jgi:hypothetical protein
LVVEWSEKILSRIGLQQLRILDTCCVTDGDTSKTATQVEALRQVTASDRVHFRPAAAFAIRAKWCTISEKLLVN